MDWLEIIELRSVNGSHKIFESNIPNILKDFQNSAAIHSIKVYSRFGLESDISIHIQHTSNKVETNGSPEGMQLVSALKKFGLTNHNIWINKESE